MVILGDHCKIISNLFFNHGYGDKAGAATYVDEENEVIRLHVPSRLLVKYLGR